MIWYRIDKSDGTITVANGVNVFRAAAGAYDAAGDVIHSGRFATPFAIYSRADQLTAEERASAS